MMHQSGKCVLIVEKDGDDLMVSVSPLTGMGAKDERGNNWLIESVWLLQYNKDWLPPQVSRMGVGDRMVFRCNYEQNYYRGDGYSSDDDEDFGFYNVRMIQHRRGANDSRRALKKFYRTKEK